MTKILNWFFGSFVRTIGRICALLFLAFGLFLILSKTGLLDNFSLDNLLFMQTNATNIYTSNWSTTLPDLQVMSAWGCSNSTTCNTDISFYTDYMSDANGNPGRPFTSMSNPLSLGQNGYTFLSYYGAYKKDYLYMTTYYFCSNYFVNYNTNSFIGAVDYNSPGVNLSSYSSQIITANLHGQPGPDPTPTFSSCREFSAYYVPNTEGLHWVALRLRNNTVQNNLYLSFISVKTEELGIYSDAIKDIVEDAISNNMTGVATESSVQQVQNTTNEIKQEIQDTQETITNNDTSDAENQAGGFFDNFSDTDFGLSSIITAPLRAINAMLNDTCVSPGATYKGQSFSLPCGSMLWDRPGGQDFKNFINIFYGGFLAYFVIRSLFLDIEKLKNPNNDKVEVQKL